MCLTTITIIYMTYKGKYKVKNKKKYKGNPDDVIYRSLWEKHCFKWCDNNPEVKYWSSEETIIPYLYEVDKKWHRYFVDLTIQYQSGKVVLVEIKPFAQTQPPKKGKRRTQKYIQEGYTYIKNINKWESAREVCEQKGWEFVIWTEKELTRMNILPKSTKKLKPFTRKPKKKI